MYWNNRVIRTKTNFNNEEVEMYTIHEVYYDSKDRIEAWTSKEVAPYGESLEELREDLLRMLRAVDETPVINREDLPGGKADGQ